MKQVLPELKDKVALVTGSAQGIGYEIAQAFAGQGCKVVINDINQEAADKSAQEINDNGGTAIALPCDVADFEASQKVCDSIVEKWGSIDILVNNAGIVMDNLFIRMKPDQWHRIIDIHLNGTYNFSFNAVSHMRKVKSGAIINISSVSADGNPGQANYSAAKAGIIGFTKAIGKELSPFNIRVNCIQPGMIDTTILQSMPEKRLQEMFRLIPMGRAGKPQEIANVALFLASDLASYVTAQVIRVSGGL